MAMKKHFPAHARRQRLKGKPTLPDATAALDAVDRRIRTEVGFTGVYSVGPSSADETRAEQIRSAFRPRPPDEQPGPVKHYTVEEVIREEVQRMGGTTDKNIVRAAVEKYIREHQGQVITAKEIRSALGLPGKNMGVVRIIGSALSRLCQPNGKRAWRCGPPPQKAAPAQQAVLPATIELFELVISVAIRPRGPLAR